MSRISRFFMAIAALASLTGGLASAADAVIWHNTGSTSFTAAGGPMTLSIGSNNLACTGSSATGVAPVLTIGATTTMSGTMTYSPCSLLGQSSFAHCIYTFTGTSFSAGVTSGAMDLTCSAAFTASPFFPVCHYQGSTAASYTNPSGSTRGRFTLFSTTGMLVSNIGGRTCPLGTGFGTMTEQTINITNGSDVGTLGPVINRTA